MTFTFVAGKQRHTAAVPAMTKHCCALDDAAKQWYMTGLPQEIQLKHMSVPLDSAITVCESILHRIIVDGVGWTMESFVDPGGRAAVAWAYGILLALGFSPWDKHAKTIVQQIGMHTTYLCNTLFMARDVLAPADLQHVVQQCRVAGYGATEAATAASMDMLCAASGIATSATMDPRDPACWEGLLSQSGPNSASGINNALRPITMQLILGGDLPALIAWADAVLARGAIEGQESAAAREAAAAAAEEREPQQQLALHPRFNAYFGMVLAHIVVLAAVYGRSRGAVSLKALVAGLHDAGWFAHPELVAAPEELVAMYKHFGLEAPDSAGTAGPHVLLEKYHQQTVMYLTHAVGPHNYGTEPLEASLHADDVLLLLTPASHGGLFQGQPEWTKAQVHGLLSALVRSGRVNQFLDMLKACGLYFVDDPAVLREGGGDDDAAAHASHDDDDGDVSLDGKHNAVNDSAAGTSKLPAGAGSVAMGVEASEEAARSIFSDDPNPRQRPADAPQPDIRLQEQHGGYHHPLGGRACLAQWVTEAANCGHGAALRTAVQQRMHPSAVELIATGNPFNYPYSGFMSHSVAECEQLLNTHAEQFANMLKQYGSRQALLGATVAARRADLFMLVLTHEAFNRLAEVAIGNGGWSERQQWLADVVAAAGKCTSAGYVSGAAALLPYARDLQWHHTEPCKRAGLEQATSYQFANEFESIARSNAAAAGCLHIALHHPLRGSVGRGTGITSTQFYLNMGVVYAMAHPSKGVDSYNRPVGGFCVHDAVLKEFLQELHAAGGGIQPPLGPHPSAPGASYDALLASANKLNRHVSTRRRAILLKHVSQLEGESMLDERKWNLEMNLALGTLNWPAVLDLFETVPACQRWTLGRAHFVASCIELAEGVKACPADTARKLLWHATHTLGFTPEQLDLSTAQRDMLAQ